MRRVEDQTSLFEEPHDPGGLLIKLPAGIRSTAAYGGPNDCYRYRLERGWEEGGKKGMFLMMNPSTATEYFDDRTLKKIRGFAMRWGFGRMLAGNTMAYRVTDQAR